jgi:CarD family transcriptional regulator
MYNIGDFVVHPMHGAGRIEDIVEEKVEGIRKEYYVFSMPVGGLVLKIPTAGTGTHGMRPVITRGEAQELMDAIPALAVEANSNWNKRYQENMNRLKSGDLYEVARVIKGLVHRENRRGLSTGERKMLYNAKQIMISEIVLAQKCTYEDAESRLMNAVTETKKQRRKSGQTEDGA